MFVPSRLKQLVNISTMDVFRNSSAYKFACFTKEELNGFRDRLRLLAKPYEGQLMGTILLSEEGINIRLSGNDKIVKEYQKKLVECDERLQNIEFKDSFSDRITLPRMLIKIKSEIISMGVQEIQPSVKGLAEHISAERFKQWIDDKKDIVVLDTRNDYEVRLGTFDNAIDLGIQSFREFPLESKKQLQDIPKDKPVVMFCTGGVRCEKASYCLKNDGFQNVYQLDGGILKYFEQVGGKHYSGECYIFDDRVSLDSNLKETATISCFVCRSPLKEEDQKSPDYIPEKSCSYCINGKQDFRTTTIR